MFSMVAVASSTRMPTASARPPMVMMLIVSPNADRQQIETRIDSGMVTKNRTVFAPAPVMLGIYRHLSASITLKGHLLTVIVTVK